jgi:hypothetical protein
MILVWYLTLAAGIFAFQLLVSLYGTKLFGEDLEKFNHFFTNLVLFSWAFLFLGGMIVYILW